MGIVSNQFLFMEICKALEKWTERRWSGNAGTDEDTGKPIIYDPSAFFGHNEYEIGIQKVSPSESILRLDVRWF